MNELRVWIILSWIALPTVMFGGYSLLQLLNRGDVLTPFQVTWFRAGTAGKEGKRGKAGQPDKPLCCGLDRTHCTGASSG